MTIPRRIASESLTQPWNAKAAKAAKKYRSSLRPLRSIVTSALARPAPRPLFVRVPPTGFLHRMRMRKIMLFARKLRELAVIALQSLQVLFRQRFHFDQSIAGAVEGGDDLVQLEVNGERVLVLGALNQKHHQERDDGRSSVDDQLPGVREMKDRPQNRPPGNDGQREGERGRAAGPARDGCGQILEAVRNRAAAALSIHSI